MKRIFAVIELADHSSFNPDNDTDMSALAEDLLCIAHGGAGAVTYSSFADLQADEKSGLG